MSFNAWPSQGVSIAVGACFEAWLEQRGGIESQETTQTLSQVRAFFEENGESEFSKWDELEPSHIKTCDRAGFCKLGEDGEMEYYVFTEAYKQRICQGLNKREVTKILSEKGWLKLDAKNNPYHTARVPKMGSVRFYVFTSKLWAAA